MLIDAVEASHLLSEKKTQELIEKIAALGGSKQAEVLTSNIVRFNTVGRTDQQQGQDPQPKCCQA